MLVGLITLLCAAPGWAADEINLWTLRPYAVHAVIVSDTVSAASDRVAEAAAQRLELRAAAVVGPLWKLTQTVATGANRDAVRRAMAESDIRQLAAASSGSEGSSSTRTSERTEEEASDETQDAAPSRAFEPALGAGFDKLMLIVIREDFDGFTVEGVEYDLYLRRLGQTRRRVAATCDAVPEQVFQLVCDVFSPVAVFSIDRENYKNASLAFRGSDLPRPPTAPIWSVEGDVFQPILRRTDREGVVPPEGIKAAPWTLLQLTDASDAPTAAVLSHTRRPFGARRRGRVEQLAIRLPLVSDTTRLRLHARDDKERPLTGYHVFARDTEEGELVELGASDHRGIVTVPRTDAVVRTLFVKSGSKLVAKLPMAPGAELELDAALVDESKRIEAEAKLSLLREELIDLVARRSILISRTKAAIQSKDFENASKFVAELEALPGLNVFNQRLTDQQQLSRSRNPSVQARIDKLFEDTRVVLGAFLGSREITELRRELSTAREQAAG